MDSFVTFTSSAFKLHFSLISRLHLRAVLVCEANEMKVLYEDCQALPLPATFLFFLKCLEAFLIDQSFNFYTALLEANLKTSSYYLGWFTSWGYHSAILLGWNSPGFLNFRSMHPFLSASLWSPMQLLWLECGSFLLFIIFLL